MLDLGDGYFTVDYIDPHLCTHFIYYNANIDSENYTIKIRYVDIDIDNKGYEVFTALKLKNPNLKVMISVRDISPRAHAKKCLFSSWKGYDTFLDSYC